MSDDSFGVVAEHDTGRVRLEPRGDTRSLTFSPTAARSMADDFENEKGRVTMAHAGITPPADLPMLGKRLRAAAEVLEDR